MKAKDVKAKDVKTKDLKAKDVALKPSILTPPATGDFKKTMTRLSSARTNPLTKSTSPHSEATDATNQKRKRRTPDSDDDSKTAKKRARPIVTDDLHGPRPHEGGRSVTRFHAKRYNLRVTDQG